MTKYRIVTTQSSAGSPWYVAERQVGIGVLKWWFPIQYTRAGSIEYVKTYLYEWIAYKKPKPPFKKQIVEWINQ